MRDPATKRARGFGFITFVDPTAIDKVLTMECHELDGKRIDPKVAFPKKQQPKMVSIKHLFVYVLYQLPSLLTRNCLFNEYVIGYLFDF